MRFLLLLISVIGLIGPAYAQFSLGVSNSMSFGILEFDDTRNGNVYLGTDGVTTTPNNFIALSGFPSAGVISITGNNGVIDLKCDRNGTVSNSSGNSFNIRDVEISVNNGVPTGNGLACTGVGNNQPVLTSVDLSGTPNPNILFGGRLRILSGNLTSGQFSSNQAGGTGITLRVVFQ